MTSPPRHCEARSDREQADNGLRSMELHRRALGRAGPVTFVATKVTKKACSRKASLPHKAFALQNGQNHGLQLFCPAFTSPPFCKNLLCLFLPHMPGIVLPFFIRS